MASTHKPVVKVGVDVRNTGSIAGTEVVQLYIRIPECERGTAGSRTEGVHRVHPPARRVEHVEFPLGFDELNFYNVDLKQVVEPTTIIWVAAAPWPTQRRH